MNIVAAIVITALISGTIGFMFHALMAAKKESDIPFKDETNKEICADCTYFEPDKYTEGYGYCKIDNQFGEETDYCGDFKERRKGNDGNTAQRPQAMVTADSKTSKDNRTAEK